VQSRQQRDDLNLPLLLTWIYAQISSFSSECYDNCVSLSSSPAEGNNIGATYDHHVQVEGQKLARDFPRKRLPNSICIGLFLETPCTWLVLTMQVGRDYPPSPPSVPPTKSFNPDCGIPFYAGKKAVASTSPSFIVRHATTIAKRREQAITCMRATLFLGHLLITRKKLIDGNHGTHTSTS
jgi:hypothetical protein